ncbi:MAG: hypothetical protein AAGD05_03860 [Bacteroidota bacterium]
MGNIERINSILLMLAVSGILCWGYQLWIRQELHLGSHWHFYPLHEQSSWTFTIDFLADSTPVFDYYHLTHQQTGYWSTRYQGLSFPGDCGARIFTYQWLDTLLKVENRLETEYIGVEYTHRECNHYRDYWQSFDHPEVDLLEWDAEFSYTPVDLRQEVRTADASAPLFIDHLLMTVSQNGTKQGEREVYWNQLPLNWATLDQRLANRHAAHSGKKVRNAVVLCVDHHLAWEAWQAVYLRLRQLEHLSLYLAFRHPHSQRASVPILVVPIEQVDAHLPDLFGH